MATYLEGRQLTLTGEFTDSSKTPTNPTMVTLYLRDPDGNETTVLQASLDNPSTGTWTYDFSTTGQTIGKWWFRFVGTGAVETADERSFVIKESVF